MISSITNAFSPPPENTTLAPPLRQHLSPTAPPASHAIPYAVPAYAHTATQPDGSIDSDETKWQLLSDHLSQVSEMAHLTASCAASNPSIPHLSEPKVKQ